MTAITVTLPFPPSANRIWRNIGRGRTLLSAEYRSWRETAAQLIAIEARNKRISGRYALHIHAGRPDKRKRDIDNLIKPLSDALAHGGAIENDCHCDWLQAQWRDDVEGVRVIVIPRAM